MMRKFEIQLIAVIEIPDHLDDGKDFPEAVNDFVDSVSYEMRSNPILESVTGTMQEKRTDALTEEWDDYLRGVATGKGIKE